MLAYSLDLRKRVVTAYEEGTATLVEIAERFSVGQTFLKKMLRQKRELGSLERLPSRAGAKKVLSKEQRRWLAKQIKAQPDATLAELQERLLTEKKVSISTSTVCRELKSLNLPPKKSRSSQQKEISINVPGTGGG